MSFTANLPACSTPPAVLARCGTADGELVLRRTGGDQRTEYELLLNGMFLMSTAAGQSSHALVARALARCRGERLRVLIGGLGFGFSARAALESPRVQEVQIIEMYPPVVEWNRKLLPSDCHDTVTDERCRVEIGDFAAWLMNADSSYDVIAADIDNGPGWLSRPENARLYEPRTLAAVAAALRPGGVFALWTLGIDDSLRSELETLFGECEVETVVDADIGGRELESQLVFARWKDCSQDVRR